MIFKALEAVDDLLIFCSITYNESCTARLKESFIPFLKIEHKNKFCMYISSNFIPITLFNIKHY